MSRICSGESEPRVSRNSALTNKPPLMPIRRWIFHTDSSMPNSASASCQARTCWYTLSIRVPSRSNSIAGRSVSGGPAVSARDAVPAEDGMLTRDTVASGAGRRRETIASRPQMHQSARPEMGAHDQRRPPAHLGCCATRSVWSVC